jgi:hypothetical protein
MRIMPLAAALALALSGTAHAQDGMATAGASLERTMAQAQVDAIHPGDEQLTCDAIQAEMTTTMTDPSMRAELDQMGETAQAQRERAEQQQAQQRAMVTTGIVTGVISSFVPGAGYAQGMLMQQQMREQEAQAQQGMRENESMMGNMEASMPQMMRGQRLYELAQTQNCPFLAEMEQQAPQ